MKKAAAAIFLWAAGLALAQTEDDLIRWVQENKPRAESGEISQLDFHREMHRRIAMIPGGTYPHIRTAAR